MRLQVLLLGPPEVSIAGKPVRLTGRLRTLLLVHLGDTYVAIADASAARKVWGHALDIYTEIRHASTDDVRAKLQHLKR